MGYIKSDIENVRNQLSNLVGEEVVIIEPMSKRGKKLRKLATISQTLDNFFTVTYDDEQTTNYNYQDVFTKDIRIQTFDGENFIPLKVPRPLTKKETIPTLIIDDPTKYFNMN